MIDEIKWSELNFGKYRGKTLPEIATSDPDWYYSHFRRKLFPPPLDEQADLIAYQLDNIKPPRPDPENWRFDYICDYEGYGKLLNMVLLRADEVVLPSPMNRQIMGHFSFLWSRYWVGYDKSCSELLVGLFQMYYFGGSRVNKAKCEAFFSNPQNFDWSDYKLWRLCPDSPLMYK